MSPYGGWGELLRSGVGRDFEFCRHKNVVLTKVLLIPPAGWVVDAPVATRTCAKRKGGEKEPQEKHTPRPAEDPRKSLTLPPEVRPREVIPHAAHPLTFEYKELE